MLKPAIQDALNKQINEELFSSYLYLSMAAYFESTNLKGMAQWMRFQAQEELGHAMKFIDYVNERDGRVLLAAIKAPETNWQGPADVFQHVYEHECRISGLINQLADLALTEKDHATGTILQWFITEQVEEEATALDVVGKLKLVGDNGVAIFMLDAELGQRAPPAVAAADPAA